jgi:hypothetical protein
MSFLKRLSEQAQQIKGEEAKLAQDVEVRKERYARITLPTMQALKDYFNELANLLKVTKPEVRATYNLPGYGDFQTILHPELTVKDDQRFSEFQLQVLWKSRIDTEKAPKLQLNSVERIRTLGETLKMYHLSGMKEEARGAAGHLSQASLQISGFIHGRMVVHAKLDDDCLRFQFDNVDRLQSTRQSIAAENASDEVFDRLAEFILRENDLFLRDNWVRGLKIAPLRTTSVERAKSINESQAIMQNTKVEFNSVDIGSGFNNATGLDEHNRKDDVLLNELRDAARLAEAAIAASIAKEESNEMTLDSLPTFNMPRTPAIERPPIAVSVPSPAPQVQVAARAPVTTKPQVAPTPTPAVRPTTVSATVAGPRQPIGPSNAPMAMPRAAPIAPEAPVKARTAAEIEEAEALERFRQRAAKRAEETGSKSDASHFMDRLKKMRENLDQNPK